MTFEMSIFPRNRTETTPDSEKVCPATRDLKMQDSCIKSVILYVAFLCSIGCLNDCWYLVMFKRLKIRTKEILKSCFLKISGITSR